MQVQSLFYFFVALTVYSGLFLVRYDLGFLFFAQYSLFGSILTVGLILGALICGKLTDLVGRVKVSFFYLRMISV